MPGLLQFDSSFLAKQIRTWGVETTWRNILFTHLSLLPDFGYILQEPFLSDGQVLEQNLIESLTIGEIGVLYEYSLALADPKNRKESGQFFTPDDVAKFMVERTFWKDFDSSGVWLDPCSGIGNLAWHLCSSQNDPESFLLNNLKLSDRDPLALKIARVLFTVSFQNTIPDFYLKIEDNFIVFDFLSVYDNTNELEGSDEWSSSIPKHDYVIVNPPYLATSKDQRFQTADSADLYAYFLENISKTSSGFVSVTPQSFTNASKFQSLRKLLISIFPHLVIYCFDNVPGNLFRGYKFGSKNSNTSNSIRAAIMVASKGQRQSHRITSLMRWKSEDRAQLLREADRFLSRQSFTKEYFPKVNSKFASLQKELDSSEVPTIGDLTSRDGEFSLYIPSSPRYFISALKTPVDRVSFHVLSFPNSASRDRAYLVINSSLAYWWWRVRDGGMTLSLSTLLSTPVPKFSLNARLIEKLESSEISSKVYKKNAGASRENVKHSRELILLVTKQVIPHWAEELCLTHENSEFAQLS
jgi:hypothetical protein